MDEGYIWRLIEGGVYSKVKKMTNRPPVCVYVDIHIYTYQYILTIYILTNVNLLVNLLIHIYTYVCILIYQSTN